MSVLVGSWGIFRLGELAAAGTAQSSVVSVLRALHEDGFQFTCTHYSPSPRISPPAWKLWRDIGSRAPGSALLGADFMGFSAKAKLRERAGKGSRKGKGQKFSGMC